MKEESSIEKRTQPARFLGRFLTGLLSGERGFFADWEAVKAGKTRLRHFFIEDETTFITVETVKTGKTSLTGVSSRMKTDEK